MRFFLAPRSNETSYKGFLSTIEHGIDFSIVEPYLDDAGKSRLSGMSKVYVWGNKETIKSSWDKMELGDLVFFYKGREGQETEGKLTYVGKLMHKQHSKPLGLALWPPKKGEEPWTCIFFLEDIRPIYIPISDISEIAGYKRAFVVQGFMPLKEEAVVSIIEKFGSIDAFLLKYSVKPEPLVSDIEKATEVTAHAEAQLLLLKIGKMLHYDTYTPDRSKKAYGERLEDFCSLKHVPTRFLGELVPIISEIDVIWFKDDIPQYAFEIEHTTKFGNAFQRLFQLKPLSVKLFVISSTKNKYLFDKFIETDPYYRFKSAYHFRDYSQLEKFFRAVSEFKAINEVFLGT